MIPSGNLRIFVWLVIALAAFSGCGQICLAQQAGADSPSAALVGALSAACRADASGFANYLTVDSASALRALPEDQRVQFLRRFSLVDDAGKPLLSADSENHAVVRCEAPQVTVEFRFGETRLRENLAFIPVDVINSERTQFGLVRENGGWRLLSLGLVLLDVPQLSKQWAEQAAAQQLAAQENAILENLSTLRDAIETYRRAFGMLPDSLAKLGPAPKNEISPDQADLVDERLASGSDNGYAFRYRIAPDADGLDSRFELSAVPANYGKSSVRSFFLDADGKMHSADHQGASASAGDPVVEAHTADVAPEGSSPSGDPPVDQTPKEENQRNSLGNAGGSYSSSANPRAPN